MKTSKFKINDIVKLISNEREDLRGLLWRVVGIDNINNVSRVYIIPTTAALKHLYVRNILLKLNESDNSLELVSRESPRRSSLCKFCPLKSNFCSKCETEFNRKTDNTQYFPGDIINVFNKRGKFETRFVNGVYLFGKGLGLYDYSHVDDFPCEIPLDYTFSGSDLHPIILARLGNTNQKFSFNLISYTNSFFEDTGKIFLKGSEFNKYFRDPDYNNTLWPCEFCVLPEEYCKDCSIKQIKI